MDRDDVKKLIEYLEGRVSLVPGESRRIVFRGPSEQEMMDAGVHVEAARQVLDSSWYTEMIEDVVETPEFCSPEEPEDELLRYARDVVGEYVRKRFRL
jgi:hypothetical protein